MESGIDQELKFGHVKFEGLIRHPGGNMGVWKSRDSHRLEIQIARL